MSDDLLKIMGLGEFSTKKSYFSEFEREKIQFERIFSEALNGIVQVTVEGEIKLFNPAFWKMCGYKDSRDLQVSCQNIGKDLFNKENEFLGLANTLRKKNKVLGYETVFKRADRNHLFVSLDAHIQVEDGTEFIEIFIQNIDKRKRAEREIIEAHKFNENILNASTLVAIISTDTEGVITQFNRGAELMLGYNREDLMFKETPALFHLESEVVHRGKELSKEYGEKIQGFEVFVKKARITGSEERFWTYVKSNGERLTVNLTVTAIYNSSGDLIGFLGVAKDVTQERRSQEELLEAKKLVNSIVDSMPSIIIGVDSFLTINLWNRRAAEYTGVSVDTALGKNPFELFSEISTLEDEITGYIDSSKINIWKKRLIQGRDGRRFCDIAVYPIDSKGFKGGVIRVDDVTEQVKMEELLVQSEKMLSVGGLAAGMAHEINNPLAGIMQHSQNLERRLFSNLPKNIEIADSLGLDLNCIKEYMDLRDIRKILSGIQESVSRASKIVKNMLSFARKGDDEFFSTSIKELVDNTLIIAESDYNLKKDLDFRKIEIKKEYDSGNDMVICNPSKIQQVFYNIIKNAAEAMNFVDYPQLYIRVYPAGKWLIVEIEDNGEGIPYEIRNRIFEPFYTTKEVGKGTGLGMSVSYFIVTKLHMGELTVESIPGEWTRFVIKLPLEE